MREKEPRPAANEAGQVKNGKKKLRSVWIVFVVCLLLAGIVIFLWHRWDGREPYPSTGPSEGNGVTIPKKEVSLAADAGGDMELFFIYQGRCYVYYESVEQADFLGEYLGTGIGLIDEWTPKEGYVELAGSASGDFFTVKGYDPSFMLCMKEPSGAVSAYLCDSGITLKYGREVLEDRLHLSDHYCTVQYESGESWFMRRNEFYQMKGNNELIGKFIRQLDSAEFLLREDFLKEKGLSEDDAFPVPVCHMAFGMENGMTVHLMLYEDGYVSFTGLKKAYLRIPQEDFRELMEMTGSHTDAESVPAPDPEKKTQETLDLCRKDPAIGPYIPDREIPGSEIQQAVISYDIEPHTGKEKGIKQVFLEYTGITASGPEYTVTIFPNIDPDKKAWGGKVLDQTELSAASLEECIVTAPRLNVPRISVGVRYDDVVVILYGFRIDAETALAFFRSLPAERSAGNG